MTDSQDTNKQQQEPFGYFKAEPFGWTDCSETDDGAIALYKRPQPAQPSKPWVWLSKEEEKQIKDNCTTVACVLKAVKAKLREKNA